MRWTPRSVTPTYLPHESGHDDEKADAIDALDFVARLLAHVPDPRRHLVHYYGAYSNVVRGKLKARGLAQKSEPLASGPGEDAPPPACTSPSLAALRRGWAQLLRRVYEVDPLVCPRCRGVMRVVSFITEGRVIRRILDHLGASARRATQERAPPPAAAAVPDSPDLSAGRGRRQRPGAGGRAEACLGHGPTRRDSPHAPGKAPRDRNGLSVSPRLAGGTAAVPAPQAVRARPDHQPHCRRKSKFLSLW